DEDAGVVGRRIPRSLALRGYLLRFPRHRHVRCILARLIDRRLCRIGGPLFRPVRDGYGHLSGISEILRIGFQTESARAIGVSILGPEAVLGRATARFIMPVI